MDIDNGIESDKSVYEEDNKSKQSLYAQKGRNGVKPSEAEKKDEVQTEIMEEQAAKEVVRHGRGR